jgi:protease-4
MEGVTRNIYEQFIKDIASGRKMDIEAVRRLAEGRIYTGNQAKEAGLIDEIGNFYDTVDALKTALAIKGKPSLVYTEKPFSFSKSIFGSFSRDFSREMTDRIFSSPFNFIMTP